MSALDTLALIIPDVRDHNKPAGAPSLFVGGPLDGRLMDWAQPVYMARSRAKPGIFPVRFDDIPVTDESSYRLTRWRSGRGEWRIYVHESLTDDEAMAYVLGGYPMSRGISTASTKLNPCRTI